MNSGGRRGGPRMAVTTLGSDQEDESRWNGTGMIEDSTEASSTRRKKLKDG